MADSKLKGNIVVVSAPSGAGKTTLSKRLLEEMPKLSFCVSHTTRAPREGEVNDKDYTFTSKDEFKRMIEAGEFAEWAEVHGNYYGTSRKRLDAMLEEGVDALLDIDVQGARNIRTIYPDGIFIFILPPSMEVLVERISGRKSNTPEDIKLRMEGALEEIKEYNKYDYVIVNDDLDEAYGQLRAVVLAERSRLSRFDTHWIEEIFLRRV